MTTVLRAHVTDDPARPPGTAVIVVGGLSRPLAPETTRLSIDTGGEEPKVLGENGWQKSDAWLTPADVEPAGDGGRLVLAPEQVSVLRTGMTLSLQVSGDGGTTALGRTAIAWPAIASAGGGLSARRFGFVAGAEPGAPKLKSEPPPLYEPPPKPEPAAKPAPEPAPAPQPVPQPAPAPIATPTPDPRPAAKKSSPLVPILVVALLLLAGLGAGGYVMFGDGLLGGGASHEAADADLSTWTRKEVAAYIATNPVSAEVFATAEKLKDLGKLDLAFLLYRENAKRGHAPSSLELGKMYDPMLFSPQTSPMPNADGRIAAEHYRAAAQGGLAEAQRYLGTMLLSGNEIPKNPEEGVYWLRKAAEQGDTEAQEALKQIEGT